MNSELRKIHLSEGHRHLEPVYMDKSHTSYTFFTGHPWTKSPRDCPYKHDHPGSDLYALAYPVARRNIEQVIDEENANQVADEPDPQFFLGEETAQYLTEVLTAELETTWSDARALKDSLNVNILTGLLEHFNDAQLKDIVNRSWSKVFDQLSSLSDASSTTVLPAQPGEDAAGWLVSYFGGGHSLPESRDFDVTERFRRLVDEVLYLEGFKRPGERNIWCTVFRSTEYTPGPGRAEIIRIMYLLPFLNQEDLSDPQILRSLLLNRISNHPRVFARADWEGCHLGRAVKTCVAGYRDNWFMGFPPEAELPRMKYPHARREVFHDYTVVFKDPTGEDTECGLFPRLKKAGLLFGWEEGIMVLVIQVMTLRFVKAVAEEVSAFVDQLRSRGEDLNRQPVSRHLPICKAHTWDTIPAELLRFDAVGKGLVTSGQFFPSSITPSSWNDEFKSRLEKRLAFAREHLQELCHDPDVFRGSIQSQYDQHYGHITDSSDNTNHTYRTLPHITNTDIDAKKALVNDLIRRVIRRAIFEVEMWQCLLDKLERLRQLARNQSTNLDDRLVTLELKGNVMDAWLDLGFHARWIAGLHVKHLSDHGGLLATRCIRDYYRRTQTWEDLRPEAPTDQWTLPRQGRLKLDFSTIANYKDPSKFKGWESVRLATDVVHRGLSSFHSIGCIGLPKIIQKMHSDRRGHDSLQVQPMVSDDYAAIFEAGLLSQRMEALLPFGGDLSTDDMRDLREKSPIWQFLKGYDHFPFEMHIDQEALRLVHWFLGVTYYHPSLPESQSRPFGLVQRWLGSFWAEIAAWLKTGDVWHPQKASIDILTQTFNDLQLSVGTKIIDTDFRMHNELFEVEDGGEDQEMTEDSEDEHENDLVIETYGKVTIIREDDFPGSQLSQFIDDKEQMKIVRILYPRSRKGQEKVKRPGQKKRKAKARGRVTKATAARSPRPSTFFKVWEKFEKGGIRFQEGTFRVTKICGKITNLRPDDYEEPPTEFVMPTRNGIINIDELKKVTLELAKCQRDDDYRKHFDKLAAADPLRGTNKMKKSEWRTMEIIYGDHSEKRKITYQDAEDLFIRLGFTFGDGSGSRARVEWTDNSHIPREKLKKTDAQTHPLHRKADTLKESHIGSFKVLLEETFGISKEMIEQYYQRTGPEYRLVDKSEESEESGESANIDPGPAGPATGST